MLSRLIRRLYHLGYEVALPGCVVFFWKFLFWKISSQLRRNLTKLYLNLIDTWAATVPPRNKAVSAPIILDLLKEAGYKGSSTFGSHRSWQKKKLTWSYLQRIDPFLKQVIIDGEKRVTYDNNGKKTPHYLWKNPNYCLVKRERNWALSVATYWQDDWFRSLLSTTNKVKTGHWKKIKAPWKCQSTYIFRCATKIELTYMENLNAPGIRRRPRTICFGVRGTPLMVWI